MDRYNNYHKHTHVSNIFTPDVNVKIEDYVKRAVELGEKNIFSTEHGSGGDIFEAREVCDKYGLDCKFGMEGYIVPDPLEKDNRNYHIILIPKTNVARKKLNKASSHANRDGYYYNPRLFLSDLTGKFDSDELFITSACMAGLVRDEDAVKQILIPLVEKFGKNVFLEVQNHNEEHQVAINEKAISFAKEHGLDIIAANDSHYIYPEQAKERLEFLKGKGINYGEEDTFILDYPNIDVMYSRFEKQGVLTKPQIIAAINNTLVFDSCENIDINKKIKMPSIYKDKTEEEKIVILKDIVNKKFNKVMEEDGSTSEERKKYAEECRKEMQVIEETSEIHTSDYFLLNDKLFDLAINKYGGILTRTGRGSCGAFYINRILGMTQLDRFSSPIKLYPERFMSTARLLENKALPDIDFNVVSQEPFVKASRELLGEHGCYPMIAYGTMKDGEAFRNVCRSHGLSFDEYNDVAKNIESYVNDKKWQPYIEESKRFVGAIVSASVHPCAHILMDTDIREELGVIRVGDFICVMITSSEADEYKYLKNDYLVVSCWKLIAETFEMINKPIMTIVELMDNIDNKVWELYKNGLTCTLNQCDGEWATSLLKEYQPVNLAQLSMFVACIRPSFNSWRDKFIAREEYSTGSLALDKVLKSTNAYILFQENLMQYFDWLGVSPAESIGLIKKISKKKIHKEDFDNLEDKLKKQWVINTGSEYMFNETWNMIQSCISYGFAAPHALAVAIDSLYSAYLKANYPLEYYTVCLNNYVNDESKTTKLTDELSAFNISIKPIKFRYSTDIYSPDTSNNAIYKGISSVKFLNADVSKQLYEMREQKFSSFIDFLKANPCNSKQTEILIKLGFFSEFGKSQKLLDICKVFGKYGGKKQIKKENLTLEEDIVLRYGTATEKMYKITDNEELLNELCKSIEDKEISIADKISAEKEYLGYISYTNPKAPDSLYYVSEMKIYKDKCKPYVTLYQLKTGRTIKSKVYKADEYSISPFKENSILNIWFDDKCKSKFIDGKWIKTNEKEKVMSHWEIVKN